MSIDVLQKELTAARRRLESQQRMLTDTQGALAVASKDKMTRLEGVLRARLLRYEATTAETAAVVKELEIKLGELDLKKR